MSSQTDLSVRVGRATHTGASEASRLLEVAHRTRLKCPVIVPNMGIHCLGICMAEHTTVARCPKLWASHTIRFTQLFLRSITERTSLWAVSQWFPHQSRQTYVSNLLMCTWKHVPSETMSSYLDLTFFCECRKLHCLFRLLFFFKWEYYFSQ